MLLNLVCCSLYVKRTQKLVIEKQKNVWIEYYKLFYIKYTTSHFGLNKLNRELTFKNKNKVVLLLKLDYLY